jgi:hypothetical protein
MASMSDDERAQLAERFEFWSKLDAELGSKPAR